MINNNPKLNRQFVPNGLSGFELFILALSKFFTQLGARTFKVKVNIFSAENG